MAKAVMTRQASHPRILNLEKCFAPLRQVRELEMESAASKYPRQKVAFEAELTEKVGNKQPERRGFAYVSTQQRIGRQQRRTQDW
jgi:hypothetical protein